MQNDGSDESTIATQFHFQIRNVDYRFKNFISRFESDKQENKKIKKRS